MDILPKQSNHDVFLSFRYMSFIILIALVFTVPLTTYIVTRTELQNILTRASGTDTVKIQLIEPGLKFIIQSVNTANISDNQATIDWGTMLPATSWVEYGLDSRSMMERSPIVLNQSTKHVVTLSNLKSRTIYYYRVYSKDMQGIDYYSHVYSFTTK